uniref:Uncharacterized protein n=1 Tax=Arundo donax TaxID=35708 RepID=A0A0A9EHN4_ARUDO
MTTKLTSTETESQTIKPTWMNAYLQLH